MSNPKPFVSEAPLDGILDDASAVVGEESVPPRREPKERRALWFVLRQVIIARWRDLARRLVRTTLVSHGNILLVPVICAHRHDVAWRAHAGGGGIRHCVRRVQLAR